MRPPPGDRPIEPLTGLPTSPLMLALLAIPVVFGVVFAFDVVESLILPEHYVEIPVATRVLHLLRGAGLALLFAFLAAWAVGRNWARALVRIRVAEARAREAERARLERERLAALGRIAAGTAHEIGNPLASISAICQLIEKKGPDERLVERIRTVRHEVDRIARIVRGLSDFGRPAPESVDRVSLGTLLDRVAGLVRVDDRAAGVEVSTEVSPPGLSFVAPAGPLEQIMLNLAWNAVEAVRGRGDAGGGRIRLRAAANGNGLLLEVADDGPGVEEGLLARIFEPFFTTKEMGTGLGLSVVHGIVDDLGGGIEVGRSDLGGALFRVFLPPAVERRTA